MTERILYIDPIGGLAGDMLCAALLDAGLDEAQWRQTLGQIAWNEDAHIVRSQTIRGVFAATHIDIKPPTGSKNTPPAELGHPHTHGQHSHTHSHAQAHSTHPTSIHSGPSPIPWSVHHRGFTEIAELISMSPLPDHVKEMATRVFRVLGDAEAEIHGTTLDEVHFHEVGAVDSILDIVGFCLGIHLLGITTIKAAAVPLSTGIIHTAHGPTPLPAPATLRILQGWPSIQGHPNHEQVTPTGAAILKALATYGPFPSMVIECDGYGAGTRNPPAYPNLVRVCIGRVEPSFDSSDSTPTDVIEIQSNIDDMSAELLSPLIERLMEAGALDVTLTPILMKKGRSGHLCTILSTEEHLESVVESLFTHSTTFGCRFTTKQRRTLHRTWDTVQTELGQARMKIGHQGNVLRQMSVEFEDAKRLAEQHIRSVSSVIAIVQHEHWKQFPHRYTGR